MLRGHSPQMFGNAGVGRDSQVNGPPSLAWQRLTKSMSFTPRGGGLGGAFHRDASDIFPADRAVLRPLEPGLLYSTQLGFGNPAGLY